MNRRFEQAEMAYDLDRLWKYVKSHKDSSSNLHAIRCDGTLYSSPIELLELWSAHYNTLFNEQVSEAEDYDNNFKTYITDTINNLKHTMSSSQDYTGVIQ